MKVGVIGNGGREHALCSSLKNSDKIKKIYCFPGNAGTGSIAINVNIDLNNFEKLKDFIILKNFKFSILFKSNYEKPFSILRNTKIFSIEKIIFDIITSF